MNDQGNIYFVNQIRLCLLKKKLEEMYLQRGYFVEFNRISIFAEKCDMRK